MTSDQQPLAPHPTLRSFYADDEERQSFVNDLFDRTARSYDWINAVMSFGSGYWYRGEVLREAGLKEGMRVLDVATGTGPVAAAARKIVGPSGLVVGIDPSAGMLHVARAKTNVARAKTNVAPASAGGACFIQATAEALPLGDERFDLLPMGYALRHVPDLRATFHEYHRVLKPGGRLVIMEISIPRSRFIRAMLRFYMGSVLPLVARFGTRNRDTETMMRYYWETTAASVSPEAIIEALSAAGFSNVWTTTRFGMLRDYHAAK
jgi:demethylmenaquinone methyltransferase/2-methoxy-6-polyprenyl-1,4-benzoquinol methylase